VVYFYSVISIEKIGKIYTSLLKEKGFEVIEAFNAHDANEIVKQEDINLVLLDIKVPEVDGSVLHEAIQLFHKKVKVIVASVYPVDEQKSTIRDATDYYDKSQGAETLLEKVKKALNDAAVKKNTYSR